MAPSLLKMGALNLCLALGVLPPIGVSKSMQRLLQADGQFPKNGSMSYERSSGETSEKTLHEEAKTTFGQRIVWRLRNAAAMLAAGKSVGEVLQSLEVSEATFSRWRRRYCGIKCEESKRSKGFRKCTFDLRR
jgi:hypothetical protein